MTEAALTQKLDVDVTIIGAGTAGMAAFRAATKRGKHAILIEAGPYGTTCARVGCMPSKLLIAAADAAHHAKESAPFGVHADVRIDGKAVMDRVRRERDRFVGFVVESVESFPADKRIQGRAHLTGANDIVVEHADGTTTEVHTKTIVIASGSSPVVPAMFDRIKDRLIINDDVFTWEALPRAVAVFGAGVIGLELGQALHRLGVRVHVFGRGNTVGPLADPAVKDAAMKIFRAELAVDFDAKILSVEPKDDGIEVRFEDESGNARSETFGCALIAAGRRPNVGSLGLAKAGIHADTRVDRGTLQWGSSNVFIAGDATNDVPLLHEAADEGALAGDNAARFPDVAPGKRRSGLGVAFTDPALAVIGGGFPAASQQPYVVGQVDFGDQGRSRIMLQNRGLARLYADPHTRRFLGGEMVGPRAEHLAHLLAWAHQSELTVDQMLAMPFYHPVIEEGLRTALRDLAAKLDDRASATDGATPGDYK